jgi:hypothetical protein
VSTSAAGGAILVQVERAELSYLILGEYCSALFENKMGMDAQIST